MAWTCGWSSIIIIALPVTLESLPDHLNEGLKVRFCEHQAFLSSIQLLRYNKLQRSCSRQQTPLVHTQGTIASLRVTQLHHASPLPLASSFLFFCIDYFFSLNVCQSVNSLTSFHPTPVKSIAEYFFPYQIIT